MKSILKLTMLLILLSAFSLTAICQSTTSEEKIDLKEVNKGLVDGLECCDLYDNLKKVDSLNNSIIDKQKKSINLLTQAKITSSKSIVILEGEVLKNNDKIVSLEEKLEKEGRRKKRWRRGAVIQGIAIAIFVAFTVTN